MRRVIRLVGVLFVMLAVAGCAVAPAVEAPTPAAQPALARPQFYEFYSPF